MNMAFKLLSKNSMSPVSRYFLHCSLFHFLRRWTSVVHYLHIMEDDPKAMISYLLPECYERFAV